MVRAGLNGAINPSFLKRTPPQPPELLAIPAFSDPPRCHGVRWRAQETAWTIASLLRQNGGDAPYLGDAHGPEASMRSRSSWENINGALPLVTKANAAELQRSSCPPGP
jgi:hypothetical protein